MMTRQLFVIVLFALIIGCKQNNNISIEPSNPLIKYVGRIDFSDTNAPEIFWSASEIEIQFTGTSVSATLVDEKGLNYFNVVIDKDSVYPLKLDKGSKTYLLAEKLDGNIPHTIELIKRNEFKTGKTVFMGFYIEDGELLQTAANSGRLIEFFGNSITSGYAINDNTGGDSPDSTYTNNYVTYAALTARHFDADMHATVREGTGIMVSWHEHIMPEIYNRVNPYDSTSIWDFNKVTPNLVVINLMQNDSWIVKQKNYPEFIRRFGDTAPSPPEIIKAYADFVALVRAEYPNTPIICALGSMDATKEGSEWPGYIKSAVASLNDKAIYTHFFKYTNKKGHPRADDNKIMAESLITFIEDTLAWK
ncbi:SGNH/GDSL hydrolase family protein [Saccharicrinis aurantiacus]|uniref:hypothetical protein n=1 Tax=Saccharicrinis aurantiacus TaxID=1849719 RepID=UPI0009FA08FD|nr:hypothetical protein [Saccharicrinis aurantiacus]